MSRITPSLDLASSLTATDWWAPVRRQVAVPPVVMAPWATRLCWRPSMPTAAERPDAMLTR